MYVKLILTLIYLWISDSTTGSIHEKPFQSSKSHGQNTTIIKVIGNVTKFQCLHRCKLQDGCTSTAFEFYDEENIGECIVLGKMDVKRKPFIFEEHNEGDLLLYEPVKVQGKL